MEQLAPPLRLVAVLEAMTRVPLDKNTRQMWAIVFSAEEANTQLLLSRVSDVIRLTADARKTVEAAIGSSNRDLHLSAFSRLESALSRIHFDAAARDLIAEATTTLAGLRFSADLVARVTPQREIAPELLASLQAEVEALSEYILGADLPADVRRLLFDRLEAVRQAILDIRLRGPEEVEAALDGFVGATTRSESSIPASDKPGFMERVAALLDLGYKVTSVVEKLPGVVRPVIQLIASVSGGPGQSA